MKEKVNTHIENGKIKTVMIETDNMQDVEPVSFIPIGFGIAFNEKRMIFCLPIKNLEEGKMLFRNAPDNMRIYLLDKETKVANNIAELEGVLKQWEE